MSNRDTDAVRMHELVTRLCDGNLDDLQTAELQSLVLNDTEAADFYVKYMHLHAAIARYNLIAPTPSEASCEIVPSAPVPVQQAWSQFSGSLRRAHVPLFFLLIACCFYGTFGFLIWSISQTSMQTAQSGSDSAGSGATTDVISTHDAVPGFVARLTGERDCVWTAAGGDRVNLTEGSPILRGQSIQLERGLAEFTCTHDVKLLVQGPAEFEFATRDRVRLRSGSATALVSASGKGFTIETADVEVVDLGTEFGVSTFSPGQSDVAVFRGEVDVRYATGLSAVGSLRLVEGQSRRFVRSANGISVDVVVADSVASGFLRGIDPAGTLLPPELRYASAVLADKPTGYWRLSDGTSGVALDSSGHDRHGRYHGALHPQQTGFRSNTSDRSVRLKGAQAEGWVEFQDFPLTESFTAEIWVRSATPVWNAHGWFVSARTGNGFILHPDASERIWRGYVHDQHGTYAEIGLHTPASIDDRFHHYAISFDSATNVGAMYFDGEAVARRSDLFVQSDRLPAVNATIEIGRDSFHGQAGTGDGWLDEFAFYDRVLAPDEIARHFAAGIANE